MTVTIAGVKPKPAHEKSELPAQEANSAPFEAIFNEHWHRVCGVLFRLVGDRNEAEDLAVEAFWRLYRRPPQDLNLAGWLYRVATNLGLNALRARKRRRRYEQEAGILELTHQTPDNPAAEAELAEQRRTVRRALAEMRPRSAQLLILRHSGLSYGEVAVALGLSVASVGALLARAEDEFERHYRKVEGR